MEDFVVFVIRGREGFIRVGNGKQVVVNFVVGYVVWFSNIVLCFCIFREVDFVVVYFIDCNNLYIVIGVVVAVYVGYLENMGDGVKVIIKVVIGSYLLNICDVIVVCIGSYVEEVFQLIGIGWVKFVRKIIIVYYYVVRGIIEWIDFVFWCYVQLVGILIIVLVGNNQGYIRGYVNIIVEEINVVFCDIVLCIISVCYGVEIIVEDLNGYIIIVILGFFVYIMSEDLCFGRLFGYDIIIVNVYVQLVIINCDRFDLIYNFKRIV